MGFLAILLGNFVGALPVALAAAIGPATGLTQMEASRMALGTIGVRPPSFLSWIYCVGWDAVNNVPAAAALVSLLMLAGVPTPFWLALVLASIQMVASIYGHHVVQALQKYLGGMLLVVFAIIGVTFAVRGGGVVQAAHPVGLATFLLAVGILVSFNLSWATYSSDYTRHLPANLIRSRWLCWLC